ncbi:MAG: transporter substrate-binding domain-containing protein, partial [Lachnospiraceae bacterium]|nr:transporter substrate-binding domain-containing protein [Lachnospiraceae bacterium]
MKKRVLAGVLSAAMVVSMSVTMVYAGETEAVSGTEAAANADGLATEGKFVVGFDAEYPPYGYMDDNGDYTGFDLELAQAVCDLEGWELVKTPIDWDSKDMELNSGNIDCIWNGFTMNGREDSYTFSVPYVNNSQVIVTADDSGINSLADLAGKTVGVQADS